MTPSNLFDHRAVLERFLKISKSNLNCLSATFQCRDFIAEEQARWNDELKHGSTEDLRREIYITCAFIVSRGDDLIDQAFEQEPLENLTPREFKAYIRSLADRSLIQAGLSRLFGTDRVFPWMDEMVSAWERGHHRVTTAEAANVSVVSFHKSVIEPPRLGKFFIHIFVSPDKQVDRLADFEERFRTEWVPAYSSPQVAKLIYTWHAILSASKVLSAAAIAAGIDCLMRHMQK